MSQQSFLRLAPKVRPGLEAGADARFELVPGVGHDRKALQARSTAFFKQVLAAPR